MFTNIILCNLFNIRVMVKAYFAKLKVQYNSPVLKESVREYSELAPVAYMEKLIAEGSYEREKIRSLELQEHIQ